MRPVQKHILQKNFLWSVCLYNTHRIRQKYSTAMLPQSTGGEIDGEKRPLIWLEMVVLVCHWVNMRVYRPKINDAMIPEITLRATPDRNPKRRSFHRSF